DLFRCADYSLSGPNCIAAIYEPGVSLARRRLQRIASQLSWLILASLDALANLLHSTLTSHQAVRPSWSPDIPQPLASAATMRRPRPHWLMSSESASAAAAVIGAWHGRR